MSQESGPSKFTTLLLEHVAGPSPLWTRVPVLHVRDYTRDYDNCVHTLPQISAIYVTEKTFLSVCIISRIRHMYVLSQLSLWNHNPAHSVCNYFSISVQFFSPGWPSHNTMHTPFFWREILVLTVLVIYISTQKPGFESVCGLFVLLVIQVISYKTDVTKYMCIFPVFLEPRRACRRVPGT